MGQTYDEIEPVLDARTDLVRYGDVPFLELRRRLFLSLPTSSHARRLTMAVLEILGDRGRVDPFTDGSTLMVLRADDSGWWLRDAPVTFTDGTFQAALILQSDLPLDPRPAEGPDAPDLRTPPRPDIAPKCGEAALTLRSYGATIELRYGPDGLLHHEPMFDFGDRFVHGRWGATAPPTVDARSRPAQRPPPAWFLDLPDRPLAIEELARRILAPPTADVTRRLSTGHGDVVLATDQGELPASPASAPPVRVRMNVDAPGGVLGCWARARHALRYLAWHDALPTEGGVVIVDAFDHPPEDACVGFGPDFDAALRAWSAEERRRRPRPVPAPPAEAPQRRASPPKAAPNIVDIRRGLPVPLGGGPLHIRISPIADIPWPIPGPLTTPAVALTLPPLPREVPEAWRARGFSRWRFQIGDSGRVHFGLARDEDDGVTEVGEHLIDALDPDSLDELLAASAERFSAARLGTYPSADYAFETRTYIAWSNVHHRAFAPKCTATSWNPVVPWGSHDGDDRCAQIVQVRRL